jgi:Calcineurin-like phosphoesterase
VSTADGSTRSPRGAGWRCEREGRYKELREEARRLEPGTTRANAEPGDDQFRWGLVSMREARNEKLANLYDPTNDQRRAWVAHMRAQGVNDLVIEAPTAGDSASFLVIGDPGEGDSSQFALVEPLRSGADGTHFAFIASDVVYPAGDVNDYRRKFYFPYREYRKPIYAIPGNHDWDDGGLFGFMFHFCGQEEAPPEVLASVPQPLRAVWRKPAGVHRRTRESVRAREVDGARVFQPGPYFALAAGPLLLVGLDLGLCSTVDRDQGAWLREVSHADPRPKILIMSKPVFADGHYYPGEIEGGGAVDDVVRDPRSNYIAVLSGEIQNYQRYPVSVEGGRTVQYIVCGAGGAFTQGTHTIDRIAVPNPNPSLPPIGEEEVRLYPLRGDSLSFFSELYARRVTEIVGMGGLRGRLLARALGVLGIPAPGALRVRPERGDRLMAQLLGLRPRRGEGEEDSPRVAEAIQRVIERRAAAIIRWLPSGQLGEVYYPYWDWDEPPFFKCFLRVDATGDEIRIRCFAATGCAEHEADPPLEDEVVWTQATGWRAGG